jgi:hypothetical protein
MSLDDLNGPAPTNAHHFWDQQDRGTYQHVTYEQRRRCRHERQDFGVLIQANELHQVVWHCTDCGYKINAVKRPAGIDLDALPIVKDNRTNRACFTHRWEPCRRIKGDGRTELVMGCMNCMHVSTLPIPGDITDPPDTWPVVTDNRFDASGYIVVPPCAHCGTHDGVQEHHWAPRELFPDADRWGTVPLCPPCHTLWHRRINRRRAS